MQENDQQWIWFFQSRMLRPFGADEVRAARENLLQSCLTHGVSYPQACDLAAAADELLSNVLEHSNAEWLDLGACQEAGSGLIRLRIQDSGTFFDPALAAQSSEVWAGDGSNRGLGLYMLKAVGQHLDYRRLPGGRNELVLSLF